jgi:hypothetical protein
MKGYSDMTVGCLTCHKHVDMTVDCLDSLLRFSTDPIRLVIHDDGSLTSEDCEKLTTALPGLRIVVRTEADEFMNERLKNHPYAYKFRHESALALKCLDIPLMHEGDITYTDSDVLYLHPFHGIFCDQPPEVGALFMQDRTEAYSIAPWAVLNGKFKLWGRINSGVFYLRRSAYDLDFIEWFLSQKQFRSIHYFVEQTLFGALGSRTNCRIVAPNQVVYVESADSIAESASVAHFVGPSRHLLKEFVSISKSVSPTLPSTRIQTIAPINCNIPEMFFLNEVSVGCPQEEYS